MTYVRGVFYCPWRHEDFDETARMLHEHRVNVVSLQRVGNGWFGYAYYPSAIKPHALAAGEDLLADALRAFHGLGIAVRAHLAVGNDPAIAEAHPDWLAVRRDGVAARPPQAWESTSYYHLCPARPEYQEYLLGVVAEIARGYPIDGIDLDYIRYPWTPAGPYCYCDHCRSTYRDSAGTDPVVLEPGQAGWEEWLDWRAARVTDLVRRIGETLRRERPRATLMAYIAAWYAETGERSEVAKIRERFGQDVAALAPHVDAYAPMLYHNYPHEPFTTVHGVGWVGAMTRWIREAGGRPVWSATQVAPRDVDPITARLAAEASMTAGAQGVVLFPLGSIASSPGPEIWPEMDKVFGRLARLELADRREEA